MPTYEYACRDCGQHLEVVQKFSDAALTECPSCQGSLRKVFGSVGIVLKGSGFYKTDSRGSKTASSGSSDTAASASGAEKSEKASSSSSSEKASGSSSSDKTPGSSGTSGTAAAS